jgi:hypothetical protein
MQIRWVNTYSKIVGEGYAIGYDRRKQCVWVIASYPWIYVLAGNIIEDEGTDGYANTKGTNPQRAFLGKILGKKQMSTATINSIMDDAIGLLDKHGTILLSEFSRRYHED